MDPRQTNCNHGLKLHPRTQMVGLARAEFHMLVANFLSDHSYLTDIELAGIMLLAPEIPIRYAL